MLIDIQGWLRNWLGIKDIEGKLVDLEHRISSIEETISLTLKHFGNYKNRTDRELLLMRSQLQTLLSSITNIIESVRNQGQQLRAIKLRSRLTNNLNRINKQLATTTDSTV